MNRLVRGKLYLPIILYLGYIGTTLSISVFGPARYIGYEKKPVLLYMAFFSLAICGGYWIGVHLKSAAGREGETNQAKEKQIIRFCEYSLLISCLGVLMFLVSDFQKGTLNFSLESIGANYITRDTFHGNGYPFEYLYRFFTGIFRYVAMSFPVLYYEKMKKKYRIVFFVFVFLYFLENCIGQGSQKSSFDLLLFCGGTWVFKKYKHAKRFLPVKEILVFAILGLLMLFYLSNNQYQRYSLIGVTADNYGDKSINGMSYDVDHFFFRAFGKELGFGLASILCGYLSAGYYGLSLCLSLPFEWTYGVGSSLVFSKLIGQLTGYYAYNDTYLARMGAMYGRDGMTSWNTIFPWLASDLTFEGAILVFIFVGVLFSYTWKEYLVYSNPVSLLAFTTVLLGLLFVPCNNQLLTGIDGFISTFCIAIFWLLFHKRFNYSR